MKTLDELKAYLVGRIELIDRMKQEGWPETSNMHSLCRHIWMQTTPHALLYLDVSGVLKHIAQCLEPPRDFDENGFDANNADAEEEDQRDGD